MKSSKFAAVIISIVFIIAAVSCSSKENQKDGDSIKTYLLDEDTNIGNAIQEYNQKNRDQITEQVFYRDQREEMTEKLRNELAVGEGPDVIIFEPDMLPELSKYMEKGVFYNIDELMKKDKDFKIEDYNSTVMEYGMYNGKRYAIPLFYSIKALFSTDALLRNSGISSGTSFLNIDDVCNTASDYMKQGKGKYFFSPLDFSYFMDTCGDYVNIAEKKASFNTTKFEKFLDSYRKLYEASDKDIAYKEYIKGSSPDMPGRGDMILNMQDINCFKLLWAGYNLFDEDISPEIRLIGQEKEAHASAIPVKLAAINAGCKNKKAAYDFIKLLLSEKYQENANVYYLPVNKKAYENQKEIFLKGSGGSDYIAPLRNKGIISDNSAKKAASDVDKLMARLDKCSLSDYKVYDIVNEVVDKFLKGSITNNEAAKEIQDKVQEYLNAGMSTPQKETMTDMAGTEKIKSKLRLFCLRGVNYRINNALRVFEKQYPEIEVKKEVFGNGDIDTDFEAYKVKLTTELMAGEGPDVVTFINSSFFQSLNKIVAAGVFCDLNEIISRDKDFNINDYNDKVLEAGVYGGKRFFLPLVYELEALYTTGKTLESSNVQYDHKNWTWDNFVGLSKSFRQRDKNNENYYWGYGLSFKNLYQNCDIRFIEYDTKKSSFNSEGFIRLMKTYKELYPKITPAEIGEIEMNKKEYFKSCVFASDVISVFNWECIMLADKDVKKYTGEELKVYPIPSIEMDNATGYVFPTESAAISASSTNKEGAFNFIKVLLSEDIQRTYDSFKNNNINFIAVNKKAYEKDMEYYSSLSLDSNDSSNSAKPQFASDFDSLLKDSKLGIVYDKNIRQIIDEEVEAYVKGSKTAQEAAAEIDRKVMLILNE